MSIQISIITATFNSQDSLRDSLDSVCIQTIPIQHLIIDGVSKDDTLSIARSYPHITRIVSEPDRGIYCAMNKGVRLATKEVIGILNSDDFYASPTVLQKVAAVFEDPDIDSCYGDLVYVNNEDTSKVTRVWISGEYDYRRFRWGWMPPHPTFFVRRSIYEKFGLFNLSLGSAADYELMLRFLVKHRITCAYLPEVLVKMRAGGISNTSLKNRILANRMDRKSWEINALKPYPWTIAMKPLRKIKQFLV